jgi:hypothetical protein
MSHVLVLSSPANQDRKKLPRVETRVLDPDQTVGVIGYDKVAQEV